MREWGTALAGVAAVIVKCVDVNVSVQGAGPRVRASLVIDYTHLVFDNTLSLLSQQPIFDVARIDAPRDKRESVRRSFTTETRIGSTYMGRDYAHLSSGSDLRRH